MNFELSDEAERRVREDFEAVLASAVPAYDIGRLGIYSEEELRFINREVERKLYEPQVPNGGDKERHIIERLKILANEDWDGALRARNAMDAWAKVLPQNPRHAGCYYVCKPLTLKANKQEFEWATMLRDGAHAAKNCKKKWFAELLLAGRPEPVSDFHLECLFLLRRSDGKVVRLVRLRNVVGEVSRGPHHNGCDLLECDLFASPEKFRGWALARGNFSWSGNQTALQMLHEDINRLSAWRVINQVDSCGWLGLGKLPSGVQSGITFSDDCAYADGKKLLPDEDGIYWWKGEGYYLNWKGRESQFLQGRPKMHPHLKVEDMGIEAALPARARGALPRTEAELRRDFYVEVCSRFYDTLGGYQGWMFLGSMFSYVAAPEIFAEYGLFPGAMLHGQMSSGKTKVAEWGMSLWGFERLSAGIGILKATAVGLLQECENYSNIPLWLDEFRTSEVGQDKMAILRDSYNRQPPAKWTPDGVQRQMKTAFLISGESTASDAATRSRFLHIQVSKDSRLANHLDWFTAHHGKFFVFIRTLLERREEFVGHVQRILSAWLRAPELQEVNERERMVHGIVYASWMAMCAMLESHDATQTAVFRTFMIEHAKSSSADVSSETNINVFWRTFVTAWKAGAIPMNCLKVRKTRLPHPPNAPNQGEWDWYEMFIDPDALIEALQQFLVKGRATMPLNRKDLRDQLSKTGYWKPGDLRQRFGKGTGGTLAYLINIDKHPMGYKQCSDEEVERFLSSKGDEPDPRKLDLFTVVHEWEMAEQERKRA
jgi:hypothetical protein